MPTGELCASLLAHPAAHSLSPALHHAALDAVGWRGRYQAEDIPPAALAERVQQLREAMAAGGTVVGANLSLPHKVAALPLLDRLTPAAQATGAVNTLFWQGGQLWGDNTDASGLRSALLDAGYQPSADHQAVVLGAGGAARAALWVLREWGVPTLILNRTAQRAEALAAEWRQADWAVQARGAQEVDWSKVGLIINASSAGLEQPDDTPLVLSPQQWAQLPAGALVYDMVYRPAWTRLRREAQAHGVRSESGLSMLVHQAALAFRRWTGEQVDTGVMSRAAQQALADQEKEA